MTVTLTDPYYRAYIAVGAHSWTVERGDPAAYGPIDGLRIGWKFPESAAWPTQPEIPYASFGVVVAEAADFSDVTEGADVTIAVWHVPDGEPLPAGYQDGLGDGSWVPIALFGGRVTAIEAKPHKLGMIYRLEALDYLVDAAEAKVSSATDSGWPAEVLEDRLTRISDLADDTFGSPPWGFWQDPGWGIFHAVAAPEVKGALDHMVEHLGQFVSQPTINGGARGVLAANPPILGIYDPITYGLQPDPARRFRINWRYRRLHNRLGGPSGMPNWLPGRFRPTGAGGTWRPDVDPEDTVVWEGTGGAAPAEGLGVLPASVVDFDADWARTKRGRAEIVAVETSLNFVDAPGSKRVRRGLPVIERTSNPPPTMTLDTTLAYAQEAGTVAEFLLPEKAQAQRWEVERFRLYADRVPDRVNRANSNNWFFMATILSSPLRVISGLPSEQNPNPGGGDFYAGILTSAEFNLQRGRYWIDFTLSREVPRAIEGVSEATSGALSCASMKLDVTQAAVAYDDLDPVYTHYDYRICRRG